MENYRNVLTFSLTQIPIYMGQFEIYLPNYIFIIEEKIQEILGLNHEINAMFLKYQYNRFSYG